VIDLLPPPPLPPQSHLRILELLHVKLHFAQRGLQLITRFLKNFEACAIGIAQLHDARNHLSDRLH
jgi:hypothetical protein